MKKNYAISLTLALSLTCSPLISLSHAQDGVPLDVAQVLETMRDSRKVRDLKSAPMTQQAAFTETLRWKVYQPAYNEVLKHLRKDPEYKNVRMFVDEFRSHDVNPNSVNTDNDLRVMVEVEPGHWAEVDTRKWADKYYEAFAKQTGFVPDPNFVPVQENPKVKPTPEDALRQQYQKHAGKYRQLATDRFHAEASRDYTDQKLKYQDLPDADKRAHGQAKARVIHGATVRQARDAQGELRYHPDGRPMLESDAHISAFKKGQAREDGTFKPLSERAVLRDAEGLAYMYLEKGDEQLRKAQDLEKKLRETPGLSRTERAQIQDQINMHKAEATAQIKKGVTSLTDVRGAYERQGFNVGQTSQSFDEASKIVSLADGSSKTDVAQLEASLKQQGFNDLSDYNAKLRGQVESLKLAQPVATTDKPLPVAPTEQPLPSQSSPGQPLPVAPNKHLVRAGKAADVASTFLGIIETTKQVNKGEHLFFNLDQDDAALEQAGKIAGANVADIMGFTAGFQSGLAADDREKERILKAIREGKSVSPVLSFVRASGEGITDVLWGMATAPFVGPLELAKEVAGYTMAARNERQAVAMAQEQERQARNARWEALEKPFSPEVTVVSAGLGNRVWGFLNQVNGESLPESVKPGQMVAFSVQPVGDWNDAVRVEWLVAGQLYQAKSANEANAASVRFSTDGLAGRNLVAVRLVDVNSGKILAHKGETLFVDGPKINPSTAKSPPSSSVASSVKQKTVAPPKQFPQTPPSLEKPASVSGGTNTSETMTSKPPSANQALLEQELQIRKKSLATTKEAFDQADEDMLRELQKINNTCHAKVKNPEMEAESRRLMNEKMAIAQEQQALMARGYVTQAEADAFNARNNALNTRIQTFNTKNTSLKTMRQEYETYLKAGIVDMGQALLMAKNLPCGVGSGYNHEAATRAFMRKKELERQLAKQESDIKKLTAQSQGQKPEEDVEYYQVKYVGIAGYSGPENLSKAQTKDFPIPRTICGTTYYDDSIVSRYFNQSVQEATSPVFIILKDGEEVSRCGAK